MDPSFATAAVPLRRENVDVGVRDNLLPERIGACRKPDREANAAWILGCAVVWWVLTS